MMAYPDPAIVGLPLCLRLHCFPPGRSSLLLWTVGLHSPRPHPHPGSARAAGRVPRGRGPSDWLRGPSSPIPAGAPSSSGRSRLPPGTTDPPEPPPPTRRSSRAQCLRGPGDLCRQSNGVSRWEKDLEAPCCSRGHGSQAAPGSRAAPAPAPHPPTSSPELREPRGRAPA